MNTDNDTREGGRAVLLMTVGRIALQALTMLAALVLPWLMPAAEYGRFVSVLVLVSFGGMLVELGLSWIEMRLMAPAWRSGDIQPALRIGSTTFFLRLALDLLVTLGLAGWLLLSPGLGLAATDIGLAALWMFGRFGTTLSATMLLPLGHRGLFVALEVSRAALHLLAAAVGYLWLGIAGVFALLAISHLPLFLLAVVVLRRHLPVSSQAFDAGLLIEHRRYLGWTTVTALFAGVQFWLPVFLVGAYLDLATAAVLGIAIQALGVLHGIGTGVRQALMPIIAEQTANQQLERSLAWSSLLMRLISAVTTAILLAWMVIGPEVLAIVLPPAYAGLHLGIALVLLGFIPLSIAASGDSLLNLRGHAATSAANLGLFCLLTLGGTLFVIAARQREAAMAVCLVYVLAAFIQVVTMRISLRQRDHLNLQIGGPLLLMVPGLALLVATLQGYVLPNWSVLPLLLGYAAYVLLSGLIRTDEIQRISLGLGLSR